MMRRHQAQAARFLILGLALAFRPGPAPAQEPKTAIRADDLAMRRIRIPGDLKIETFAAEPLLLNPVAFWIDVKGRFYVAETFRLHAGVTDIRSHMDWLNDDLASRTVEDRVAMYRKHLGKDFPTYAQFEDRLRLLEDTNGDGKADRSVVFADGFKDAADGIGAGVIERKGSVWFTCIPDLWRLRDSNGDGKAEVRERLQHGFGVHVGFLGHDLHGLRFGPDGKLYFSIGDRGLNVATASGPVQSLDTGAVLRCDPDGSNLEVFASGLRNPQELAFDDYGNLFTVDNNSDSGDQARAVHLVEGGDSGWRIGYQFIERPVSRGPWNAEKLWHPQWSGQAAFIVPPLANITDGPSGFTRNPGTGLSERYADRFFVCDFRGGSGNSGIRSFRLKPKGASFEVTDADQFVWTVLATDVEFGPDGALYFCDWVEGWEKPNKGRIYKLTQLADQGHPLAAETARLLREGMPGRSIEELLKLLAFADQRVRQEAQFELADRGGAAIAALEKLAGDAAQPRIARVHAIWCLGQIGRGNAGARASLPNLLTAEDSEIRAQSAKVLGDAKDARGADRLIGLLADPEPRVRMLAAISLGRLRRPDAIPAAIKMLAENADRDPYLRHAGVMALAGAGDVARLLEFAADPEPAARMGVLLALRRLAHRELARFLNDSDPRIVLEAVRAIHDVPVLDAMPALAGLGESAGYEDALLKRVLAANFRVGGAECAGRIAAIAVAPKASAMVREEALFELSHWAEPPVLDRVVGVWRPIAGRSPDAAAAALEPHYQALLNGPTELMASLTADAIGRLKVKIAAGELKAIVANPKKPGGLRVRALRALDALGDPGIAGAVKIAVADPNGTVRTGGLELLAKLDPREAAPLLGKIVDQGSRSEQQSVLAILGGMRLAEADSVIVDRLQKLIAGNLQPELALDVLEASRARSENPRIRALLEKFQAAKPKADPLADYREALVGGNAGRGLAIFRENAQAQCIRCHKVRGTGGEVGPDLTGIGAKQKREYLLESMVVPGAQIAKGFETIVIAKSDGSVVTGILKNDERDKLRLITAEGKFVEVSKNEIEEQKRGASAMPLDLVKQLTKPQIRDLVEYLATLD